MEKCILSVFLSLLLFACPTDENDINEEEALFLNIEIISSISQMTGYAPFYNVNQDDSFNNYVLEQNYVLNNPLKIIKLQPG